MNTQYEGPSTLIYWDRFYEKQSDHPWQFEWYKISVDSIIGQLHSLFSEGDWILNIGCGNSPLSYEILQKQKKYKLKNDTNTNWFENHLYFINIDYSTKLSTTFNSKKNTRKIREKAKKSNQNDVKKLEEKGDAYLINSQSCFLFMDATRMNFKNDQFENVLDKGTMDALLSHNEVESGDNAVVQSLVSEIYRVLKNNGKFIMISGMDSNIIFPYFCCKEEEIWDLEVKELKLDLKQGRSQYYFYVIKAQK